MPVVLRWRGYRCFFYSEEGNEPPHVHVFQAGREVKIWLLDGTVADNAGFPQHELRTLCRLVMEHQTDLLEAWYEHFGIGT
jgi:hypothetical protein